MARKREREKPHIDPEDIVRSSLAADDTLPDELKDLLMEEARRLAKQPRQHRRRA